MKLHFSLGIFYSWAIDEVLLIVLLAMPTSAGVVFALRALFVHFFAVSLICAADYFEENAVRVRLILGAVLYAIAVGIALIIWYR